MSVSTKKSLEKPYTPPWPVSFTREPTTVRFQLPRTGIQLSNPAQYIEFDTAIVARAESRDASSSGTDAAIHFLSSQIGNMTTAMRQLTTRVESLEKMLVPVVETLAEYVQLPRDVSDDVARAEIKSFFEARHGETLSPDEIADVLDLDLDQAVRICRQLAKEGEIGESGKG